MKLPKWFGRAPEVKDSRAGAAMVLTPGQAVWSNRDYAAFASEGYRKNVVAYQAINKIADAVASVPWNVFRGETELTAHPLTELLARPNPMQSGAQYMRAKVGFFLLAGNGYEERVTVGGNVRELYQLRPDRMQIIPGSNGFPIAYQYKASGRTIRWDVEPGTFDCDVRHLKSFNPLDDWYGLSAIEAGAFAVDQNNQAMEWMQALLQNSARPSGALSSPQDKDLTDEQFNRLKAQIEDQYSGARNAGRPMLLEGGLKWEQMGLSPVDMQIIETKFSSARDVALALGVPPQLLGIPGDNTYSNYAEARLAFWEDTVIPLLDVIADDWNYWLAEPMGVQLRPDLDQIPAIADKRRILWDMADKATDLTLNERRAMKGYEPIAGGDEILVASSQISLGMAVNPPELPQDLTAADVKAFVYGVSPPPLRTDAPPPKGK
jgi:HK97 family phage portal protein